MHIDILQAMGDEYVGWTLRKLLSVIEGVHQRGGESSV